MTQNESKPAGPDLTRGVKLSELDGEKLVGHVGDQEVLLVKSGSEIFAIEAHCSHYHGPLVDGLVDSDCIHCPWHHAAFDLRSGEALRAPAFNPLTCWRVEQRGDQIFVREKIAAEHVASHRPSDTPKRVVVIGGGAAGFAAVEMLHRRGYSGSIVMFGSETAAPIDRPNLSKDYLAGSAPAEWVPLRPDSYYQDVKIDLRLATEVTSIDSPAHEVVTADGSKTAYDRLLLATGAEPVKLAIPGSDRPHVFTLRSLDDCRAIIQAAEHARHAVIIGASFIGLEVAAALRSRNVEVHVVAPEKRPMERVFGPQLGDFVRRLHEEHGVAFHLERTATAINDKSVTLNSAESLDADLVVVGIGVRPRLLLAEKAGLRLDRGVLVDEFLETSVPGIYAAGDIARWPDPHSGENIRVEHWVVAQRQGQIAALNMLGQRRKFDAVPFFWSQQYDVPINYVGHAEQWDEITIEGDVEARDCLLTFRRNGRNLAVASIFRDLGSLKAEANMRMKMT